MTPDEQEALVAAVTARVCVKLKPLFEQAAADIEKVLEHTVVRFERRIDTLEKNLSAVVNEHRNFGKRLSLVEDPLEAAGAEGE